MSMKKSNDTIGNRTRDLPSRSAVPRPNAPSRAPYAFDKAELYILRKYHYIFSLYTDVP